MNENRESTTPECCKNCVHLNKDGSCKTVHTRCLKWVIWFCHEWAAIQEELKPYKSNTEKGEVVK